MGRPPGQVVRTANEGTTGQAFGCMARCAARTLTRPAADSRPANGWRAARKAGSPPRRGRPRSPVSLGREPRGQQEQRTREEHHRRCTGDREVVAAARIGQDGMSARFEAGSASFEYGLANVEAPADAKDAPYPHGYCCPSASTSPAADSRPRHSFCPKGCKGRFPLVPDAHTWQNPP